MSARRLPDTTELTDEAWQSLAPLLPPAKSGGRSRHYPIGAGLHGSHDILRGGGAWRVMPHELPHWQTAYQTWRAWRQDGTWCRLHDQLHAAVRSRLGRQR
jgi:putative transposase